MFEGMLVCDAQVHGPDLPVVLRTVGSVGGWDRDVIEPQMSALGVDCAVLVPLRGSDNDRAITEFTRGDSGDRFGVMPMFPFEDVLRGQRPAGLVEQWAGTPGVMGIRASFYHDEVRRLLVDEQVEWLWDAAASHDLCVSINAAGNVEKVSGIAERHPGLRIILDHMGLSPFDIYSDFTDALKPVLGLARFSNVAVKLSGLPRAVAEEYPFPGLEMPVRAVVDNFTPQRTFWGSDVTRMPCSYGDCLRLFTDGLSFLDDADREWILGRALRDWIRWDWHSAARRLRED